jgi:4-diphosphocytidyl-2-C-methyl-D-erythritol kinase
MTNLHAFAPAKLNLYLHVTGRRPDGYHDLCSLVAFATVGDDLRLEPDASFSFHIEGSQAPALANDDPDNNLVVKAARGLAALTGKDLNLKLTLVKNLPVASGIGGGSSDAAAVLRLLANYWGLVQSNHRIFEVAAKLGQDVVSCLVIQNNYLTAQGTAPAPKLPSVACVLVNPGKGLPTPDVYKVCRESGAAFSPSAQLTESPQSVGTLVAELRKRTNDLYAPACWLMPEIADVIAAIEKTDPLFARMSGSGATCFGLYKDKTTAENVAKILQQQNPNWWVAAAELPFAEGQ